LKSVSFYVLSECRGDEINVDCCIYLCYLVISWNFAKLFPWLLVLCVGNIYFGKVAILYDFFSKICNYQHVIGPTPGKVHCSGRVVGGRRLDRKETGIRSLTGSGTKRAGVPIASVGEFPVSMAVDDTAF